MSLFVRSHSDTNHAIASGRRLAVRARVMTAQAGFDCVIWAKHVEAIAGNTGEGSTWGGLKPANDQDEHAFDYRPKGRARMLLTGPMPEGNMLENDSMFDPGSGQAQAFIEPYLPDRFPEHEWAMNLPVWEMQIGDLVQMMLGAGAYVFMEVVERQGHMLVGDAGVTYVLNKRDELDSMRPFMLEDGDVQIPPQQPANGTCRDGVDGKDGLPGPPGPPGPAGKDGVDGLPGPAGRDGIDGTDGKDGLPGPPGRDGINGTDGRDGRDGQTGPAGEPGPVGPPGPAGRDGMDGRDGVDGRPGAPFQIAQTYSSIIQMLEDVGQPEHSFGLIVCDDMAPDNGKLFVWSGGSWTFIVDMAGQPGIQGPQGVPGPAGRDGKDGLPGPAGELGPAGPPGAPGRDGLNGRDGQTGPAGRDGANGVDGMAGPPGKDGAAGQGFNYRGAWAANTAYKPYDVVTQDGQTYLSTTSFTSAGTFNGSNWNLLAAKGANASGGSGGEGAPPKMLPTWYEAGRYYPPFFPQYVTVASAASSQCAQFFILDTALENISISALAINLTGANTNAKLQMGIYSANSSTGLPDKLLGATAAIATGSTGLKEAGIGPVSLIAGQRFYRSFLITGGEPTIACVTASTTRFMRGSTNPASNTGFTGLYLFGKSVMADASGSFTDTHQNFALPAVFIKAG